MGGLFGDEELEKRKRVLAAQAEIYRQTLKLEVHNLRVYGDRARRRLSPIKLAAPLLVAAGPVAAFLFRSRKAPAPPASGVGRLMNWWHAYQKFSPILQIFLAKWLARRPSAPDGQTRTTTRVL